MKKFEAKLKKAWTSYIHGWNDAAAMYFYPGNDVVKNVKF